MEFLEDQLLSNYSSMKLGGTARFLCKATSENDFLEAAKFAKENSLKIITIGHGTNVIFTDSGFDGLVVVNQYSGIKIENNQIIAKSGSSWDKVVEISVDNNLCGLEALSLVPGTVGGAPVNNIGAYGQEIKDTLVYVKALNNITGEIVKLSNIMCEFSYRNSIFKEKDHGKFQILEVAMSLRQFEPRKYNPPNYPAVQNALDGVTDINPKIVREKIINIRQSKLPNPKKEPNTGSFFKNPIINKASFDEFIGNNPTAPYYELANNTYKVPAGWLIDNLGLKGKIMNGIEIYEKQALVLVNRTAVSYKELEKTIQYIQNEIKSEYNIDLFIEPEIITND
jgi:UDP-N-acetylmuramate dehydrogenase